MTFFAGDNLRAVTGGRWLQRPLSDADGIGTDTRADLAGKAFVAIAGPTHDGHRHLDAAAESGAVLALVERPPTEPWPPSLGVLLVAETRPALAQIARAYRRSLGATRVVAITGSAGKTTTKGLVHAVLGSAYRGTAAPRSFNNDIGVPMTILAARPQDRYLVVEIGTNAPGEMAHLAGIVEPDLAVITSLGRAHLGGFGSVEAIAREKASLLAHRRPGGVAFVSADAPVLETATRGQSEIVRFGAAEDADLRLTDRGRHVGDAGGWWFEVNGRFRFDLALPGRHNALNALAAVGVGRRFGLDDEAIGAALAGVTAEPMRLGRETTGGANAWRVFNDAYNANPESMVAGLETFIEEAADAPRRIVVLGDMLELGASEAALHTELGRHLIDVDSRCRIDHAVFVGPLAGHAAAAVGRVWSPTRITAFTALDRAAIEMVRDALRPADAIFVKASRGLGLERLVESLRAGDGVAPVVH